VLRHRLVAAVELICKSEAAPALAMVFALLIAAIMWNLGTCISVFPASSSHTLIGSITASALPMR